ncbi:AzlD domain-containing protein [bacterium]|nr:AzlD domain-containing protein [bacterium]
MYNVIVVIIMALLTYLSRILPLVFIKNQITNKFIKSFLYYIPYAVLACLTFPAIFHFSSNIYLSLIGTALALVLSILNQKMYIVVLASVVVVFGCSYFFY